MNALVPIDRGAEALHNIEAEAALLGALMIDNNMVDRAMDHVAVTDFFEPLHARIFEAIIRARAAGRAANPITLKTEFVNDQAIIDIGGIGYLADLTANGSALIAALDFAKEIADMAKRRKLHAALTAATAQIAGGKISDVAGTIEAAIFEVTEQASPVFEFSGGEALKMVVARQRDINENGRRTGAMSGVISDIDALFGGLERKHLTVLAARPAMGKTATATSLAWSLAANGHGVGFISLEMGAQDLAGRMAADITHHIGRGVPHGAIRDGNMSADQIASVETAYDFIAGLPLLMVDASNITLTRLKALARRIKHRFEAQGRTLEVLIVDYLGLMRGEGRTENRTQEIGAISRGLKQLAKEFNIHLIALSQLNRGVEAREDKRPLLSDLRDSGDVEQDADNILFLYREEYYLRLTEPDMANAKAYDAWNTRMEMSRGKIEFIAAKSRHGETGRRNGYFFGANQAVRGSDFYTSGRIL